MRRFVERNPRLLGLMIVTVILVGGGAAILWGKTRLVPDLAAEARAAYARQDWKGTELLARKRLKQLPDDPTALQLAARAAARQDRDQTAIAIYSRLILEDMDAEDLFLLGRALSRTGKVDLAFKTYERARLANPDHPETLEALAQLYLQNDRENAAEEAAERLVRQPGWEARGLLILGTARAELHDPAGAAQALRRFFELDPEGTVAAPSPVRPFRLLLARSLLKTRRPAEARQVLAEPPCPRTGRRGLVAARPLLHPGTRLGSGRRPARAERFLSRRATARVRARPLRGRGSLRRLPFRDLPVLDREQARHDVLPSPGSRQAGAALKPRA